MITRAKPVGDPIVLATIPINKNIKAERRNKAVANKATYIIFREHKNNFAKINDFFKTEKMNQTPTFIKIHILRFFGRKDKLTCRLVSKKFKTIAENLFSYNIFGFLNKLISKNIEDKKTAEKIIAFFPKTTECFFSQINRLAKGDLVWCEMNKKTIKAILELLGIDLKTLRLNF